MQNKIKDQRGTMLLESVIAILVLCLVVMSLLMMADILIRGRQAATENYDCAFELNALRDELSSQIEKTKDADPMTLQQTAEATLLRYPKWQCLLVNLQGRLAIFQLIYQGISEPHVYEVKIYAP